MTDRVRRSRPKTSCQPSPFLSLFNVHSRDMMSASEVFANMLENDMRESEEGQIVLPGKSKEEFRTLLQFISVQQGSAPPNITKENVELLLKWADEYQILGLRSRCEKFLEHELRSFGAKNIIGRLQLAVQYNLQDLEKTASTKLAGSIFRHRCEAVQFIDNPTIMKAILPALFKEARLEPPAELPTDMADTETVMVDKTFWDGSFKQNR